MNIEHVLLSTLKNTNTTTLQGTYLGAVANLFQNDFFSAGIGIMILTWIFTYVRYWVMRIYSYITSKFVYTITVDSDDESFQWLLEWLAEQPYAKTARNLSVSTTSNSVGKRMSRQHDPFQDYRLQDSRRPTIYFVPAIGMHMFFYQSRLIWFSRNSKQMGQDDTQMGGFFQMGSAQAVAPGPNKEQITLTMWGRNRKVLEDVIKEAMDNYYAKSEGKTWIYTCGNFRSNWTKSCERKNRAFESVILPPDVKDLLFNDIQTFLKSSEWYRACGVPYRRGYLLYGPPGTGKTSFILSVAGTLNMSVCVLNLNTNGMTDERLNELLLFTPPNSIILLEDIDCAFQKKKQNGMQPNYMTVNVTFAGLLNALDGAASQEGRIIFMTTNHLEALSPALIRPGRVDLKVCFDLANEYQVEQMFLKFHSDDIDTATKIKKLIPPHTVSCAQLQGFYLGHRYNSKDVLINYKKFLQEAEEEKQREKKRKEEEKKDEEEASKHLSKLQQLTALGVPAHQASALAALKTPTSKPTKDPFEEKEKEDAEKEKGKKPHFEETEEEKENSPTESPNEQISQETDIKPKPKTAPQQPKPEPAKTEAPKSQISKRKKKSKKEE